MRGLHPTIIIPQAGLHSIPSGHLAALALVLPPGGVLRIVVSHIGATQDHSIRAWISSDETPGGIGLPITGWSGRSYWNPNRTPDEVVFLHDDEVPADPAWRAPIPSRPGIRWLNLLNLANAENACSVETALTTV